MDQVVTQRLLASRTIKEAQRTALTGAWLLFLLYISGLALGVALTIWFRGCDPGLLGKIASIDQILPYYVNTYLVHVPGFLGLFLAGIVSAATSTVSSTINSQVAILYVDVIARRYKNADHHVLWITRGIAFILGICMTIYSTLCVHMGSVTMVFMMVYNSITSAFVGLCLLAVLFPFVHCKGAGVATLITIAYQTLHVSRIIRSGRKPPRMDVSLDYCPENQTSIVEALDRSRDALESTDESFILFRVSYMWTSFFAIFAVVIIGVLVSCLTGIWLLQVEPSFQAVYVISQRTRYAHLLAALPGDVALHVRDLLTATQSPTPNYTHKAAILARTFLSERRRLQELLSATRYGDRQPSQLLLHMQHLLEPRTSTFNEALLKHRFLQRLPVLVQTVLLGASERSLPGLASLADKLYEVSPPYLVAFQATVAETDHARVHLTNS
ncbi:sodium-coupled monocarboxylate transporter 2-like [Dermacentor albipictus]|uniref:sodium-coupled monocarboxylate transporter 2-like n=1 Tax=Dermacentor albipictus TaxID=60249 RepID=UPI0038FCEAA0